MIENNHGDRTNVVLVVGMPDSIHLARWLGQFRESPTRFLIFPSSPARRVRPELEQLLASSEPGNFKLIGFPIWLALPLWAADKVFDNRIRGLFLRRCIRKYQPQILHCLEMQGAGYILLKAYRGLKASLRPKRIIVTNWGSDIYWFRQFAQHREKISSLLTIATDYSAECVRDVELAREFGFRGNAFPVFPNSGGLPDKLFSAPLRPVGERNVILVKGYQGWVGRAVIALRAIEGLSELLNDYQIVVYSANFRTLVEVWRIRIRSGLKISLYRKGALSHEEMMSLFSSSKLHVGLSLSDAISTAVLESFANGVIPVQTSTACVSEWFEGGGVAVDELSVAAVRAAISHGLVIANAGDDVLELNRERVRSRASESIVKRASAAFYR
jgi:glycosyltransferase involved in cell wall biosynthesis